MTGREVRAGQWYSGRVSTRTHHQLTGTGADGFLLFLLLVARSSFFFFFFVFLYVVLRSNLRCWLRSCCLGHAESHERLIVFDEAQDFQSNQIRQRLQLREASDVYRSATRTILT